MAFRYFELFQQYEYEDVKLAKRYVDSGMFFAVKTGDPNIIGSAHQFKGWHYQDQSEFINAKNEFFKSLSFFEKAKNLQGIADAYGNIGNAFSDVDDLKNSLNYHLKSLEENDEILHHKPKGLSIERALDGRTIALHNVAGIFKQIGIYDKALEYEYKSIVNEIRTKNLSGQAISYNTLGSIHMELDNIDSAEIYYRKALDIYSTTSLPYEAASTYELYSTLLGSNLTKSKQSEYFYKAYQTRLDLGDRSGEATGLLLWGKTHFNDVSADSLMTILNRADYLINNFGLVGYHERYYHLLAKTLARKKDYKSAFQAMMKYLDEKELSDIDQHSMDIIAGEVGYEWQMKSHYDSLEIENGFAIERLGTQKEITRQQNIIYLSIIGFILLGVSLYVFVQSSRRRKKLNVLLSSKNELIQQQKAEVEAVHKSVSNSINYAKRLQKAILPTTELVNQFLPESFLIFLPKDKVSGDFYWFEHKKDLIFLAAADCTGHGVPGAMVSIVCSVALDRSVNEFGLLKPDEILNKTREIVVETFTKSGEEVDDGMDIALIAFNLKTKELSFAGANNPLWIVRQGSEPIDGSKVLTGELCKLYEIKGDKQPIGVYPENKPYTEHKIQLMEGDTFYLFSDGFIDQFGEETGKKFKSSNLKTKLIEVHQAPMKEQGENLLNVFNAWKGDEEQVDDVCLMGVKI